MINEPYRFIIITGMYGYLPMYLSTHTLKRTFADAIPSRSDYFAISGSVWGSWSVRVFWFDPMIPFLREDPSMKFPSVWIWGNKTALIDILNEMFNILFINWGLKIDTLTRENIIRKPVLVYQSTIKYWLPIYRVSNSLVIFSSIIKDLKSGRMDIKMSIKWNIKLILCFRSITIALSAICVEFVQCYQHLNYIFCLKR